MNGLIIEGVAGTGKSTLLNMLKESKIFGSKFHRNHFIQEENTLGELFWTNAKYNKKNRRYANYDTHLFNHPILRLHWLVRSYITLYYSVQKSGQKRRFLTSPFA